MLKVERLDQQPKTVRKWERSSNVLERTRNGARDEDLVREGGRDDMGYERRGGLASWDAERRKVGRRDVQNGS